MQRNGFTLIEFMIVVVIIGILMAIAIPNFLAMQDRAKETRVKEICHAVQLAAEEYAGRHAGEYPEKIEDLEGLLPDSTMLKNPFTNVVDYPVLGTADEPGEVAYQPIINGEDQLPRKIVGYVITGFGKDALILDLPSPGL